MKILSWDEVGHDRMLEHLKQRYETSMFLLGNYESFGAKLLDHPNSGNFKALVKEDRVVGAFSLTRRGNLIVQLDLSHIDESSVATICTSSLSEGIPVKGVLGSWEAADSIWRRLSEAGVVSRPTFHSKEVLYRLGELSGVCAADETTEIRTLLSEDFTCWRSLRLAYLKEEGLPHDLSEAQLKQSYDTLVQNETVWGCFETNGALVAMVGLNAKAMDIGQVGGVYTVPEFRKRGLAKSCMRVMMHECALKKKLKKMILFTGEKNTAARALYKSLGYEQIGHFALIFS